MYITDKIYKLFKACCNIVDEPPSPRPYRRSLPNSRSVYKTIRFNEKYTGIVL